MLTRLIVDLYGWIIEISLWFILLLAGVAGFHGVVPILKSSGWVLENETAWRIFGAVLSPVVAFLVLVVLFGPILVLVDIRKSVRSLEAATRNSDGGGTALPIEYRDLPKKGREKIDLTIVVDMLLTGFDSKYLNTLYVDKNLRHHGLIQAFSRTNRALNATKPYGHVLDFRNQQAAFDEAIALFSGARADAAREIWLVDKAPKVIEKLKAQVRLLNDFMKSQGLEARPKAVPNLKRQNYMTDDHIARIIKTYQERPEKPIERYARRVEMKEIESQDYNLNISRYVSTAQDEVEIDLKATHTELVSIDGEIRTATAKHNAFLKELGLPPLPLSDSD